MPQNADIINLLSNIVTKEINLCIRFGAKYAFSSIFCIYASKIFCAVKRYRLHCSPSPETSRILLPSGAAPPLTSLSARHLQSKATPHNSARADFEKNQVLMMAVFRSNTLCITRKSDEIRA